MVKPFTTSRFGYGTKLENGIKPYAELGAGLSAADGVEILDGANFTVEVGATIPITDSYSAKAKFEHKWGEMMPAIGSLKLAPSTSSDNR